MPRDAGVFSVVMKAAAAGCEATTLEALVGMMGGLGALAASTLCSEWYGVATGNGDRGTLECLLRLGC